MQATKHLPDPGSRWSRYGTHLCSKCGSGHGDQRQALVCCALAPVWLGEGTGASRACAPHQASTSIGAKDSAAFSCGRCKFVYRNWEDAHECCAIESLSRADVPSGIATSPDMALPVACPQCGQLFGHGPSDLHDAYLAARCCLGAKVPWNAIAALARLAVNGATWLEAIDQVAPAATNSSAMPSLAGGTSFVLEA